MSQNKEAKRIPPTDSPDNTEKKPATHFDPAFTMDRQQQHAKVERFLKLGYTQADILRVLESLQHDAQTNDILEELIKTCQTRTHNDHSVPDSPKLVPRGCSPSPGQPRPGQDRELAAGFRPVVIDGSNVAMSHGDKKVFSCQGLQLAVSWFWDKGMRDITVFIPLWRKEQPRPDTAITDQHILHELERRKILVYTPSRCVNGKRVVCYDDRYIVKLAFESDGIIVSNDNYRDLQTENPHWKKFIEERLLMYTFANDKFMPPYDPLGRNGPTIDDFLRKKPWTPDNKLQHCPYGKKCTYGVKCKFYHPERANQSQLSVADELRALRDRAKIFSPNLSQDAHCPPRYQSEPRYGSSIPLAPSEEDQLHRASPSEPFVHHRGLQHCLSPDVDEAFGSMESSVSRLYIHDMPYSMERPLHSFSSGVASCSLGLEDLSLSGSYSSNIQMPFLSGEGYHIHQSCSLSCQCRCAHQQSSMAPHHRHQPAWASCPPLPVHIEYPLLAERQYYRLPSSRQTHTMPRDPWVQDSLSDSRISSRDKSPSSERRRALRSQLSTLFPQSTVEQVMNAYPDISDMSQLIHLIQKYRTSHITL